VANLSTLPRPITHGRLLTLRPPCWATDSGANLAKGHSPEAETPEFSVVVAASPELLVTVRRRPREKTLSSFRHSKPRSPHV